MKTKFLLTILTIGLAFGAIAADTKPSSVIQIDHEKVAAAFAKGGPLLATKDYKIQGGHREAPGIVEIHDHDTDIFYVLEGTATFVTGGKTVEPKKAEAGETRGKEIVGGESHKLNKGDIIVIPNGVPHWFKEVSRPFVYYVVKVSK